MSRAPKVSRKVWNLATQPPCFESRDSWAEWLENRCDAHAPCEDCTPEFKRAAVGRLRCVRPETVFMKGDDGVFGICADDPRFARLLLGMKIHGAEPAGPGIDDTDRWTRLLHLIERRANDAVKRAIKVWTRRGRRGDE